MRRQLAVFLSGDAARVVQDLRMVWHSRQADRIGPHITLVHELDESANVRRELEDVAAWRARPLDALYPIAYFDAIMVKVTEGRSVKTRACYLAVGVSLEGEREILGLWWQETEGREVLAGRAQ